MPIFDGSRYANSTLLQITAADGKTRPTIYWRPGFPPSGTFIYHKVVHGDRLDGLAAAYYNDPTLWWNIANANPEVFYPDALDPGTMIRIPVGSG